MDSKRVIEIAKKYFVQYFGEEWRSVIEERLDGTTLYFVKPSTVNDVAKKLAKDLHVTPCDNDSNKFVEESVNDIAKCNHGIPGTLFDRKQTDENGKPYLLKAIVVMDCTGRIYENSHLDRQMDVTINHELVHTVSTFLKGDEVVKGVVPKNNAMGKKNVRWCDLHEWITQKIAIEITKMMHADGVVYNERIKPENARYDWCKITEREDIVKKPNAFDEKRKDVNKSMITGNRKLAEDTLNGNATERFTDKLVGYRDYIKSSIMKHVAQIKAKFSEDTKGK